jgi:hypothetical protein
MDKIRRELSPEDARAFLQIWWKERMRAARRAFNDPDEVAKIIELLEAQQADSE